MVRLWKQQFQERSLDILIDISQFLQSIPSQGGIHNLSSEFWGFSPVGHILNFSKIKKLGKIAAQTNLTDFFQCRRAAALLGASFCLGPSHCSERENTELRSTKFLGKCSSHDSLTSSLTYAILLSFLKCPCSSHFPNMVQHHFHTMWLTSRLEQHTCNFFILPKQKHFLLCGVKPCLDATSPFPIPVPFSREIIWSKANIVSPAAYKAKAHASKYFQVLCTEQQPTTATVFSKCLAMSFDCHFCCITIYFVA